MAVIELETALEKKDFELLSNLGMTAANNGIWLWLVGGSVRDIILGSQINDFDLTSEAPAEDLGKLLIASHHGLIKSKSQFKTQKLVFDSTIIDLATTRKETYAKPGALPVISWGSLEEDLIRRDFSINSMAVSLHPDNFGILVDKNYGQQDINNRLIRILHPSSFLDDPTRLFRAVRYQIRLGFDIENQTLGLINQSSPFIAGISAARLRREIELILHEENSVEILMEATRLEILSHVNPLFKTSLLKNPLIQSIQRGCKGNVLLGVLGSVLPEKEILNLKKRLGVTKKQAKILDDINYLKKIESIFTAPLDANHLYSMLLATDREAILVIASTTSNPMVARNLDRYLAGNLLRMPLSGAELIELGLKPGPEIGMMQRELRCAMIDRIILDKRDAVLFVLTKLEESLN
ncbi:MAG: hypothetical protein CL777_04960 [Chloroflexi bacterium]|nr:hypothetical protein [Chloroflexota bacterium]MBI68079.1 hypothetical protein [Chloroflexota bacterium]|tara:strand:- start:4128 stop:5354 length:1227 start_codon:yes stop_codon:yes gene_type:complete